MEIDTPFESSDTSGSIKKYLTKEDTVENDQTWLMHKFYETSLQTFVSVWDIYIKFYTVFLTANVLGLGLAVEHLQHGHRGP
jgi:hypothetical protein